MTIRGSIPVSVVCWLAAAAAAWGQGSTLPAAQPTAPVQAGTSVPAPTVEASRRARVTWVGGVLTISAENSSINQILREVSRVTGMKVTGGVADERVFGSYGPGAPDEVLRTLLTGTGTNMLLKESAEGAPVELALTPRQGGATPPGPATYASRGDEREDDLPPQQVTPRGRGLGQARPAFPDTPAAANTGSAPTPAQADSGTQTAAPATPAAATTDVQSPNGVKTPQQIYDQLMKLQQQKAQPAPPQ